MWLLCPLIVIQVLARALATMNARQEVILEQVIALPGEGQR